MFDKLNTKEKWKIFCDKLQESTEAHIPKKNVNQVEHIDQNGWTNKSWEWYGINPEHIKSVKAWKLIILWNLGTG